MLALDTTHSYYENYAREYFRATYNLNLSHIWKKLESQLKPDAFILDLGCGSGRDLLRFSHQGFRAIGIDYSYNLLKLAANYSHQPVVLGNLATLPFLENTFDAAWSIGSLLHFPRQSLSAVLSQIRRVLKPNTPFLTSVKKGDGEIIDNFGRYTVFYNLEEWKYLIEEAGFKMIEINEEKEERIAVKGNKTIIDWIVCLSQ